jgi:hypothetical protein
MMPLIVTIALPISALFFFLMAWLQLPVWLFAVFGTLWPQLILGLVERRIRRELRRRALDGVEGQPAPAAPLQSGDPVLFALASLGACGALMAIAGAWGPGAALLAGAALTLLAAIAWAQPARRERAALGPGSGKPDELPSSEDRP